MMKTTFRLEQVTCPSCIKKIENTLSKTPGVDEVEMLFHSSKVKTQFDETKIDAEQLGNIIEKLGYTVLSKKLS